MNKSITMRAGLHTEEDEFTFRQLEKYCYRMGIGLSLVRINNSIVLTFTAPEQQLAELESHLEKVSGEYK